MIDDEFSIIDALADVLRWEGYRVMTAGNGREGLDLVAREHPTLVLLDVMMPVMDGHQMLEALREDPATAQLPVILMTAAPLDHGAQQRWNAVLRKPFSLNVLLETISSTLKDHNDGVRPPDGVA